MDESASAQLSSAQLETYAQLYPVLFSLFPSLPTPAPALILRIRVIAVFGSSSEHSLAIFIVTLNTLSPYLPLNQFLFMHILLWVGGGGAGGAGWGCGTTLNTFWTFVKNLLHGARLQTQTARFDLFLAQAKPISSSNFSSICVYTLAPSTQHTHTHIHTRTRTFPLVTRFECNVFFLAV